jgi:hypothetical protein
VDFTCRKEFFSTCLHGPCQETKKFRTNFIRSNSVHMGCLYHIRTVFSFQKDCRHLNYDVNCLSSVSFCSFVFCGGLTVILISVPVTITSINKLSGSFSNRYIEAPISDPVLQSMVNVIVVAPKIGTSDDVFSP